MGHEVVPGLRSLKTLHLTNCWHSSSGGIGTFYRALFETAEREGHFIRLVVPGESTSVEDIGHFGRIYHIEAPRAPLNPDYRLVLPHRYLFPRTALQRIINAEQPDLVEISDKYALNYLGGLLRTRRLPGVTVRPTVLGMSHERMDENMGVYLTRGRIGRSFCTWYMKHIYFPMFDHHITVSEHTAEELIRASKGHKVRRGIWIAPMGVDCDRFSPARRSTAARRALEEKAGANRNQSILLYAGRLAPEKNLSLLIETAAQLDPARFRLLIVGGGILLDELKRECANRGLDHVVFTGHMSDREQLADWFACADAFVHPNPNEPFGITPLEAMASGAALIAPRAGGVISYANESNAWLAEPTAPEFRRAIESALTDPAREQKQQAARETAEAHRWPVVTARYLQLYRELHALTQGAGAPRSFTARIWSTPGDAFGRELAKL